MGLRAELDVAAKRKTTAPMRNRTLAVKPVAQSLLIELGEAGTGISNQLTN
jgi:hypothetical protein